MTAPTGSSRPLNPAEIELSHSVFGDAIDYDKVRIFNRKWWFFHPKRVTMAPDGNLWFHPKGGLFRDDYSEADLNLKGLFIHEMVHVWQHQAGIFLPIARHPFCQYDYQLVPGKPFAKYGIEQQAEIVRHDFLLKQGARLKNGYTAKHFAGLVPFNAQYLGN
ncbi:MAG: vgr related protein [Parasphingorhabdus sp.]|uniref:vgr related protein n=1 Tax=Parasphingorhabdus sp. TaxID=2709688 RepID=UPI003298AE01